jgi:hypothetical protein
MAAKDSKPSVAGTAASSSAHCYRFLKLESRREKMSEKIRRNRETESRTQHVAAFVPHLPGIIKLFDGAGEGQPTEKQG